MEAADGFSNVSKTELLRGVVVEKLTAAAQEILAVVERTVACYEEEASGLRQEIDRQRRQLENLLQPRIKLETIDDQFPVCELAASLPQEEQQHKYESNDQFPVCEPAAGGGAELVEEEEQHKYEMRVEDSRSLGLMCYTEAQMEEDQEPLTEPDYQVFSRLLTPTVESDRRSSAGKPRVHALQDHIDLRIRVLEDSLIKVVSADMFKKYAMQEVKCPRGLQEADFLDLLRSTFPQLADRRPFDFFTADKTKRLQPVRVKPLTPEEIDRHISSTGHSALYIRLKDLSSETDAAVRRTQEELKSTELLPRSQTNVAAPASPPPAPDQTRLSSPRVKSDRRKPGRPRTSERQNHVDLRIRILEDSQLGVLSPNVFQMCPVLELQCPRGLQEADFLHLLRSTFPQLAARRPFDFFTIDRTKTLQPLRVETRTPEEIHRAAGHSALYIRLKPPEEIQTRDKGPLQKKDAATCSPSIDQTKLYKRVKSDRNSFSRTQTGEPQNLIDLRIFILEDSQIDVLSCSVYKKYAVQALQCPGGLREADFLDLLRSTFPQLAAGRPFDFFTTDKTKKLQPLRVKPLTPEEINRHIRSTGHSALYIRLKAQKEVQISEEELHRADADKYSSSTSDQTRLNTRVKSDRISFSRPQTGEPQNLVDLRIFILEDSQIDVLSCSVYKKYTVQALQCPGGLREADFLDLLRSTFPQLAAGRPFDFFTTDKTKKLQPLRVKPLTPEEINRHIRSTGHSALYIRLKAQEEVQISAEEFHRADAVKYSSSTSDQTRLNTRKMAELSEEIKEVICNTLPRVSEETQWQIITKLQSSGLESREDLKHVQQEDLAGLLPAVQLRKLLNAFRSEVETLELDQVIPTSSPQSGASFESPSLSSGPAPHPSQLSNTALSPGRAGLGYPSSSLYAVPSQILNSWSETFQVPWPQMPQEILSAVADGRRPKPVERRQMVRVLVDEMRKFETNPSRSECLTVVRNIIRQYPKSFADITPNGSLLGRGYMSLLIQVKNRVDNVNRGSRGRRAFRSGSTFKRGQSDTYGCTRLQPELPPEETDETLEQSRQTLEEIYRQEGAGGAVRADVKDLMKLTFCLQRHHINVLPPPSVADLKSKWPFLFTQRYIFAHFESLTDISVLRSFEVAMEECGRAITEYFRWKPSNKDVMDVLSNRKDKEMALHIVQLLMAHFGENLSGLVLITDESVTAADVETTFTLPASPRLILLVTGRTGQVSIGRWMITLEGRVISEGITPTFLTGLAAVFAIYYIFNLHYQDEAARTLEFIQSNPVQSSSSTSQHEDMKTEEADNEDGGTSESAGLWSLLVLSDSEGDRDDVSADDWEPNKSEKRLRKSEPKRTKRKRQTGVEHSAVRTMTMMSQKVASGDGDALSCKVCCALRGSMNMLIKHACSHVADPERLCGVCGEHSESAEELRNHLQSHQKTHSCHICGKSFLSTNGLSGHVARHRGHKPHMCKICHKSFTQKWVLKNHMWTHAADKPHKCDLCPKSFVSKVDLTRHRLTHMRESLHRCDACGESFSSFDRLSKHTSKHSGHTVRETKSACGICSKAFKTRRQLQVHMRVHVTSKPYKCSVCEKAFSYNQCVKRHMKTQHGGPDLCKTEASVQIPSSRINGTKSVFKRVR